MLAKIAEEFGFKIGSYQHGLETYKVAEAVKANAIGASLFSDWWAYKVDVQDAIAQAGPILWETGVSVSYNSDSDELVRRLNTEAAKQATGQGANDQSHYHVYTAQAEDQHDPHCRNDCVHRFTPAI